MGKKIFYKPELNREKAALIARCLTHCLTCEGLTLQYSEEAVLLHFIESVGERDFLESTLTRIEQIRAVKSKTNPEVDESVRALRAAIGLSSELDPDVSDSPDREHEDT